MNEQDDKFHIFDEMVAALSDVVDEYRGTDSPYWQEKIQLIERAKRIQGQRAPMKS